MRRIEEKKFDFNRFYKEIALGGGVGLRMDFTFFVFRFDFGYKIYDPAVSQWINGFKFKELTFNFGIGYPF
jgi:outer membrane protein assembly factor BamA